MSKSRYSKNKSYGAMVGLNSYNRNMGKQAQLVPQENRQMRRARGERGRKGCASTR